MKNSLKHLITDLAVALTISRNPDEISHITVSSVGEPFVKLLETVVTEKSKFEEVIEALLEFLYKIVDLFFKGDTFKKPGFFKYITVAKTLIDLIVKVWKIFSK